MLQITLQWSNVTYDTALSLHQCTTVDKDHRGTWKQILSSMVASEQDKCGLLEKCNFYLSHICALIKGDPIRI